LLEGIKKIFRTHIYYNMSVVVKHELSQLERIRKLLENQLGTLLTSDLAKFNIPRIYLSILEHNGEIEQVSRGIYRLVASIDDEMFTFQVRYKSSIFSHESALFLHDLTDRTPLSYSISVPVGYHSISLNESGTKIFYVNRKLFALGVILMKSPHGNEIRTTNLERTICDVLRSRNKVDFQFVNEALKKYVSHKDKNIDRLYNYAKLIRIQKILRTYIEILL
jgi:predicted transcriptional regulator of viral defense system